MVSVGSLTPPLLLSHYSLLIFCVPTPFNPSLYLHAIPSYFLPTYPIWSHWIYAQRSCLHEWAVREELHQWPRWLESL